MERKKRISQTETDLALGVLKTRQAPMHYKELISEVLQQMGEATDSPSRLAQIHTEINLDSRFVFLGKGMWSLASWSPKTNRPAAPVPNERNYQPKHSDYVWEETDEEEDDERECLIPVEEEDDGFPLEDDADEPVEDDEEDEPEA